MSKDLARYVDKFGFIGHFRPDGTLEFGDGTQRTFTDDTVTFLLSDEKKRKYDSEFVAIRLNLITKSHTHKEKTYYQWTRHWDNKMWPGELWCLSRDNFEMMFWAAALYSPYHSEVKWQMNLMLVRIRQRLGVLWNYRHIWPGENDEPKLPDFITPWGYLTRFIRGKRFWLLYPILYFLDLTEIIVAIIRVVKGFIDPTKTGDCLNFQGRIMV